MGRSVVGIVAGGVDFGEADRVVYLLTPEGRLSAFAPSAKKSRRRFGGALEPFTTIRAHLGRRRRDDLHTLLSADILRARLGLSRDLGRLAVGSYAAELALSVAPEGASTDLPVLLEALLDQLVDGPASLARRRAFEVAVLDALGVGPNLEGCPECGLPGRFLDFRRGGAFCESHRGSAGEIGPKTRAWLLSSGSRGAQDSFGPLTPSEAERAARSVGPSLDASLKELVGRVLGSRALLAELGL